MTITRNQKIIALAVSYVVVAAVGRYTVSEKIVTVTKTVEVEKKHEDDKTDEKKNTHVKKVIQTTKKPDGTITRTTTVTDDSTDDTKTNDTIATTDNKQTDSITTITKGSDKVTISALGGWDLTQGKLVYGVSATKPILGPITVGAWALTNPSFGISLGLQF